MVKKKYEVVCANNHFVTYTVEAESPEEAKELALMGEYIDVEEDQFYTPDTFEVQSVEELEED